MFLVIDAASLIWLGALFKDDSKNSTSRHGPSSGCQSRLPVKQVLEDQHQLKDYSVVDSNMPRSKFGWSLQDTVQDPSCTGLANFRNKFRQRRRLHYLHDTATVDDETDDDDQSIGEEATRMTAKSPTSERSWTSEENLTHQMAAATDLSRFYRRQTSFSQMSDTSSSRRIHSSMSDSGYPSLTSTGSDDSSDNHLSTTTLNTGVPGHFSAFHGRIPLSSCNRMAPIASEASSSSESVDCWRGSVHHAMAVIEHRSEEIPSLFDQLQELKSDLTSMSRQVGDLNDSVQESAISYQRHSYTQQQQQHQQQQQNQQQRRRLPLRTSSLSGSRPPSLCGSRSTTPTMSLNRRRRCFDSCTDLHSLTEDEMASIVHRLLTRVCELSLSRQDTNGRNEIPLIV